MGGMQLRIFTEPQQGADYGRQLAVARAAEELGFDAFFRSDHYLTIGGSGLPGPTDSWVTLPRLARETPRTTLPTLVSPPTLPHPHPPAAARGGCGSRVPRWRTWARAGASWGWGPAGSPTSTAPTGSRSPAWANGSTGWRSSWRSSPGCGRRRWARRSPSTGPITR